MGWESSDVVRFDLEPLGGEGEGFIWGGVCVRMCHIFYINLYILFISEDIFPRFAENVSSYENMSVNNFLVILNNKKATITNVWKSLICSKS